MITSGQYTAAINFFPLLMKHKVRNNETQLHPINKGHSIWVKKSSCNPPSAKKGSNDNKANYK